MSAFSHAVPHRLEGWCFLCLLWAEEINIQQLTVRTAQALNTSKNRDPDLVMAKTQVRASWVLVTNGTLM